MVAIRTGCMKGCVGSGSDCTRCIDRQVSRDVVQEWAAFLRGFGLETYLTFTYNDLYGEEFGIKTERAALRDARKFLRELGYRGRYFLAVEWHREREIPHLHGMIEDIWRKSVFQAWYGSGRGMARVLPLTSGGFEYCCKYVLKDMHGDSIGMFL